MRSSKAEYGHGAWTRVMSEAEMYDEMDITQAEYCVCGCIGYVCSSSMSMILVAWPTCGGAWAVVIRIDLLINVLSCPGYVCNACS